MIEEGVLAARKEVSWDCVYDELIFDLVLHFLSGKEPVTLALKVSDCRSLESTPISLTMLAVGTLGAIVDFEQAFQNSNTLYYLGIRAIFDPPFPFFVYDVPKSLWLSASYMGRRINLLATSSSRLCSGSPSLPSLWRQCHQSQ